MSLNGITPDVGVSAGVSDGLTWSGKSRRRYKHLRVPRTSMPASMPGRRQTARQHPRRDAADVRSNGRWKSSFGRFAGCNCGVGRSCRMRWRAARPGKVNFAKRFLTAHRCSTTCTTSRRTSSCKRCARLVWKGLEAGAICETGRSRDASPGAEMEFSRQPFYPHRPLVISGKCSNRRTCLRSRPGQVSHRT